MKKLDDYLDKIINLKQLKTLCEDYDNYEGDYPESRFEGCSVFEYILFRMLKKSVEVETEYEEVDYNIRNIRYIIKIRGE